ncbi:hypothetical protein, partial [Tsukamurella spumae]|uniref:hypothetical protein n=1 Tax=Tsukamurella spumae TaxID=44753 RepID=UPI0031D9D825
RGAGYATRRAPPASGRLASWGPHSGLSGGGIGQARQRAGHPPPWAAMAGHRAGPATVIDHPGTVGADAGWVG